MYEDYVLLATLIIGMVSTINFILLSVSLNKEKKKIRFNSSILNSFDQWLFNNIGYYMVKFLNEKLGKEMVEENQLSITSDFALSGIQYVCENIYTSIPDFYIDYMTKFYGEEKLFNFIRERVREVFIKYIEDQIKKRSSAKAFNSTEDENNNS